MVKEAELAYIPKNMVEVTDPEIARKIMNLMDALDNLDDVTNTYSNFTFPET